MTVVSDRPGTRVHDAVPGRRRFTPEDLWRIPRVGGPVPSPDGRLVVVPVTTHAVGAPTITRLHVLPADGGPARPLTADDAVAGAPTWSPCGGRLAFTRRPAADEDAAPQLHVLRLDGGEAERVTDLPLGVLDARWLPDGTGLVVASKLIRGHDTIEASRAERDRRRDDPVKAHVTEDRLYRFWDRWLTGGEVPHLFHLDLATGGCRDLTPDAAGWFDFMEPRGQFDVAPDGTEVAYAALVLDEDRDEVESRIFRVPIEGGASECLTPDAPAAARRPRYTPDGSAIVYGRTEDPYFYADRARLYRFDRRTGAHAPWCAEWDHAPGQWELAPDGTLLLVAEHRARVHLYALAPDGDEPRLVAEGGAIDAPRPASDGHACYVRHSIQAPPEVHRCPLAGGEPARLTTFTADAMADVALGEVREIETTGAAGEPVQAFVILPPGEAPAGPAPFVNIVHGGPHGVNGDDFHFRWNVHLFAAPGCVVATPNFQGSTSWGNDYAQRIQGAWAERPFQDVMAVADAVVASGLVDEDRMAAVGASYGGYMMCWIAGHTDRFRCLVNHAGVYNTLSMYSSDSTKGRAQAFGGEPWDGLDAIDRCNPARFTGDMTTPMLVIHGDLDYRVPVTQGLECYGVLKAKGVPARLVHFPDENHWILKPHNALRWHAEVRGWLDRWLGTADG